MAPLSFPLFIWKNHRGLALFSVIFIATLQFLIVKLVADIDIAPIVSAVLEQLPPRVRSFINEQFLTLLSVQGAAAFGLNHPLALILLAINAVGIPLRDLAGGIESGGMEWLLSHPLTRTRLLLSLWTTAAVMLLVIVAGAVAGALSGILIYHQLTLDLFRKLLQIGANLWLLFLFIHSYTLLLAVFAREGSKTGIRSAAITLSCYLLHFFDKIWDFLSFSKPFNFFNYYTPQDLMFEQGNLGLNAAVLSTLSLVCLGAAVYQFNRRDIPG